MTKFSLKLGVLIFFLETCLCTSASYRFTFASFDSLGPPRPPVLRKRTKLCSGLRSVVDCMMHMGRRAGDVVTGKRPCMVKSLVFLIYNNITSENSTVRVACDNGGRKETIDN